MFHVPLGALFSADAVSSCVPVWLGKAFWTFELMDSIDSIVMQRSWHRSKVLKSPGTIFEYFRMILQNTSAIFSLSFLRSPALWQMWQSVHTFFTYGPQHETSYMKNTFISPRPSSWSFLKCESLNLLIYCLFI